MAVIEEIKEDVRFINNYHAYCRLCQHHFFSCSKINNINSFFQNHLNLYTHIQNVQTTDINENKSPIVWKKWLYTGFCNICNMSDIEAFIIYTESNIVDIVKNHVMGCKHKNRLCETEKQNVKNLFAILDFFSQICIFRESENYLCQLCEVKIHGEYLIDEHLSSKKHCNQLSQLIKSRCNITLSEIRNVSHMKEILIQLKNHQIYKVEKPNLHSWEKLYKNPLKSCRKITLDFKSQFQSLTMDNLGFFPKLIEQELSVKDEDFYNRTMSFCTLCNMGCVNMNKHFASNSHKMRVMIFKQCLSVGSISNTEYLTSCVNRLLNIQNGIMKYNIIKKFLESQGLTYGLCFKPEYSHVNLNIEKIKETNRNPEDVETKYSSISKECHGKNKMDKKKNKITYVNFNNSKTLVEKKVLSEMKRIEEGKIGFYAGVNNAVAGVGSKAEVFFCFVCLTCEDFNEVKSQVLQKICKADRSHCKMLVVRREDMLGFRCVPGNCKSNFGIKRVGDEHLITLPKAQIQPISELFYKDNLMTLIDTLIREASMKEQLHSEKEKESIICKSLYSILSKCCPSSSCHIFGSRSAGLAFAKADLDIFVGSEDQYFGKSNQDHSFQADIVRRAHKAIKKSGKFHSVRAVTTCRVPIVKCRHVDTNTDCDISFQNGLSCEKTKLLKFMISLDSRVKGLLLFVKYWITKNNLKYRPKFSSHAINMLIIFYLQQEPNPVLPTIEYLKNCYTGPERKIHVWDCGFSTDMDRIPKTSNKDSLIELIRGFFKFCTEFDYKSYVISPLTGKSLDRNLFKKTGFWLPDPYIKYIKDINVEQYSNNEIICIMDPLDLSSNLTKGFPSDSFSLFLNYSKVSAYLLSEIQ